MLLQPGCQGGEVARAGLDAGLVATREVRIEVLVHVDGDVIGGVGELVEVIGGGRVGLAGGVVAAGGLRPAVPTRVAVPWGDDELFGAGGADAVDGGLVVGEEQVGVHVVGFVLNESVRLARFPIIKVLNVKTLCPLAQDTAQRHRLIKNIP